MPTKTVLVPSPSPSQPELIAEIQALRQLTEDLERRIRENAANIQPQDRQDNKFSPWTPSSSVDQLAEPKTPPSTAEQMVEVVTHLQRVSMGRNSHEATFIEDLTLKIDRIRNITQERTHFTQSGKSVPCIWLPCHDEARVLLDHYITGISWFQYVVHRPSLPDAMDNVYRQISNRETIKPGDLILLLSVLANATHIWVQPDVVGNEGSLFLSSAQANAQTRLWVRAAYAVIEAAQDTAALALETIQGIILLSFVISNLEGVSLRYRSLLSTGMLFARQQGLHLIDAGSDPTSVSSIQAEMSRRVWWYLVATDWYAT